VAVGGGAVRSVRAPRTLSAVARIGSALTSALGGCLTRTVRLGEGLSMGGAGWEQ
jgi:hypothetical protein